jgi:hypothetical protein
MVILSLDFNLEDTVINFVDIRDYAIIFNQSFAKFIINCFIKGINNFKDFLQLDIYFDSKLGFNFVKNLDN